MKNFKLRDGVELNVVEMSRVYEYYKVCCTEDYLTDTYPEWDEDTIKEVAAEANELMDDYHLSEDEAIEEVLTTRQ